MTGPLDPSRLEAKPRRQAAGDPAREMGACVIRLEDVHFGYHLLGSRISADCDNPLAKSLGKLGGILTRSGKRRVTVQALRGVTLDIKRGERIGIMGANGAGKSTLLRVIAGIFPPESGRVRVAGKIAAILGQSHGMDPELSGYENIRIRALFLGLSNDEIDEKIHEVAEFSELGPYLDMPIRAYSPGMKMRLGFSVSTCFAADVLLLDEWLQVGDQDFMDKARQRMKEFYAAAGTVILVSHNRRLIEQNCDSIIIMEHGLIIDRIEVDRPSSDDPGHASIPFTADLAD